jgi:hypothetical protein
LVNPFGISGLSLFAEANVGRDKNQQQNGQKKWVGKRLMREKEKGR